MAIDRANLTTTLRRVPVCPVTAIFVAEYLPEKWKKYAHTNAEWFEKKENEEMVRNT